MSRWQTPVPYTLVPTDDSESFDSFGPHATGLPIGGHKGAYAVRRKFHTHEGVDLYVPEHTPITAVESGVVVAVSPFTGPCANSPWWEDTWAVLIEGETGVVVYGEVVPNSALSVGDEVLQGDLMGFVKRVLRVDKGRPMSMLHLELHYHGTTETREWNAGCSKPSSLRDPTEHLARSFLITEDFDEAQEAPLEAGPEGPPEGSEVLLEVRFVRPGG